MKRKEILVASLVLLTLFFLPAFTSAEIYVFQEGLRDYNIGDEIVFSFEIDEPLPVQDYAEAVLVCSGDERVIFKQFISFTSTNYRSFNVSSLADLEGSCHLEARFNGESVSTQDFEISSRIITEVYPSGSVFNPGDIIYVNGTAEKLSKESFSYSVELSIGDTDYTTVGFSEKEFFLNTTIDSELAADSYDLKLYFVEKDVFGDVLNTYTYKTNISILQKPTSVDLHFDESVTPPTDFTISADLLDQSGDIMDDEVIILKVFDPTNDLFYEGTVSSNNSVELSLDSNALLGGWKVSAFYGSISSVRPFYILEYRNVTVAFSNATSYVTIQNVGNIPYEGTVEITLTNESGEFIIPFVVDIPVGGKVNESIGHIGEYDLVTDSGVFSNVLITGNVIGFSGSTSIVVIALIVLLLAFLIWFFFYSKKRAKKVKEDKDIPHHVLMSKDANLTYIKQKQETTEPEFKTIKASSLQSYTAKSDDSLRDLISKDLKEKEIDISAYSDLQTPIAEPREEKKETLQTTNTDIPVVKQAVHAHRMREAAAAQKQRELLAKKKHAHTKKKVYALFFRRDSEELVILLKKYGLNVYKAGGMRFSLLKSSKEADHLLLNLAKLIITKTQNQDVVLHSVPFEESNALSGFFSSIKAVLSERPGLLVSSNVLAKLPSRKGFSFYKDLGHKESVLKLFSYTTLA